MSASIPILDNLHEDASVAGGGGEVFLPRWVPPTLRTLAPDLAENHHSIVLELSYLLKPGTPIACFNLRELGDELIHGGEKTKGQLRRFRRGIDQEACRTNGLITLGLPSTFPLLPPTPPPPLLLPPRHHQAANVSQDEGALAGQGGRSLP